MDASQKTSSMKKLTPAEKGYIAGILDGEGHLYITGRHDSEVSYSRIRVRMTDKCVIDFLMRRTGIGILSSHMPKQLRKDGGPKKCVYEWTVLKRVDMRELLKAIRPYLVLKGRSADLLLELEFLKDQGAANGYEADRIKKAISRRSTRNYIRA